MAMFGNTTVSEADDLLDDMLRGVDGRAAGMNKPAGALWMPAAAVKRYACNPLDGTRIVYGKHGRDFIGIEDDRHIVTLGPTRSGKGTGGILPNGVTYKGSMIFMGPKPENADLTARTRAETLGHKVFIIDPFEEVKPSLAKYRARFNPLSILNPKGKTLIADARVIADSLVVAERRGGESSHWDESARAIIAAIILHVATFADYEGRRDLNTVRHLLLNGVEITVGDKLLTGYEGLWAEMKKNKAARGVVAGAGASFARKSFNEAAAIMSTALRNTDFLDIEGIQETVGGHDFELRDLKRQKMTLYICLPATRLPDCFRLFRLILNLLLLAVEQEKARPSLPVILLIDEFHSLGYMKLIEVAAGLIAGYGLRLWTVFQDLTQLKGLYRDSWETFLGNAGVIQVLGGADLTTLEWISKRLGQTSVMVEGLRALTPEGLNKGEVVHGKSHAMAALLEPVEISEKFSRSDKRARELLLLAGERPIVLSKVVSYRDAPFAGRMDTDNAD